jgi:hypothetical protein
MHWISMTDLIPILQMALGPVILISGVGLILLTMTNRLGRIIDRSRMFVFELSKADDKNRDGIIEQVGILFERGRIIRLAILLASLSALLAAVLVITLFFIALFQKELAWIIVTLFVLCMLSLIGSLLVFIKDINRTLIALKLEYKQDGIYKQIN